MSKERCLVCDPLQAKEAFLSQTSIQNANGGTLFENPTISLFHSRPAMATCKNANANYAVFYRDAGI